MGYRTSSENDVMFNVVFFLVINDESCKIMSSADMQETHSFNVELWWIIISYSVNIQSPAVNWLKNK